MQLVLALAVFMLLGGGKSPNCELSGSDMLEVLKYVSGDDGKMDKIIKEAEQVTQIINAIAPIANFAGAKGEEQTNATSSGVGNIGLILQPVANIADDSIYNALAAAV